MSSILVVLIKSLIASKYLTVDKLVCVEGVAVGCGWQAFVAYVNVGCYYLVGVPLGVLLGFKSDLGAKGIWSGMLGGTILQTIIFAVGYSESRLGEGGTECSKPVEYMG
ncbi:hypothetical protein OIU78_000118 [Salix suchowensis]|nr:hypothetical protein OIU78_000118 [Salix suchowensis]